MRSETASIRALTFTSSHLTVEFELTPHACARARSTHAACPQGVALLALGGQVPVDRGAADAEGPGDLAGLSPRARRALAAASLSASITVGRPPVRPWAFAAARPAMVRSWVMSRSSSAKAAIMVKKNLP